MNEIELFLERADANRRGKTYTLAIGIADEECILPVVICEQNEDYESLSPTTLVNNFAQKNNVVVPEGNVYLFKNYTREQVTKAIGYVHDLGEEPFDEEQCRAAMRNNVN